MKHSGVLGQKWGVRRAEWYPIDKYKAHLESLGYSKRAIAKKMKKAERGERKYQKAVAKNRAKNLAKAKQARENSLALKKEKEDIIKTGDINRAIERIDDFSNEELNLIRTRNQAKIDISKAKTDAMLSKMGTVADATQKISNITTNGINIYNNIAKIANIFSDTELPIINNGNNNQQNNNQNNNSNQNNNQQNNKDQAKRDKQIDKDIDKRIKDLDKAAKKNAEKAAKEAKRNEEPEHFSGEVEGEPFKKETYEKAAKAAEDIIFDTVWKDITNSNVQKGEQYVQEALPQMKYPLLEMKKK